MLKSQEEMERYLQNIVPEDACYDHKMAFIAGPRQVGKTYLAKTYLKSPQNYFNWDDVEFRKAWLKAPLKSLQMAEKGPVILDEIHKYKKWKSSLKGVYDKIGQQVPIVVTGSAKLDLYTKSKESLMGRYLNYRLHPITVSETSKNLPVPDELEPRKIKYPLQDLEVLSGFPEPLLRGTEAKAKRWSRLRFEQMINIDVRSLSQIQDVQMLMTLADILPERVASPLSLNSLREDLDLPYSTTREWVNLLETVYFGFRIRPYAKNIARGLKKEPKFYVYDVTRIKNKGFRLENIVALHLLKTCQFWTDTAQGEFDLRYVRTKEKEEVDFCLLRDGEPWMLVECKSNSTTLSPALQKISEKFPKALAYQLTQQKVDKIIIGTNVRLINVEKFLSMFV